MNIFDLTIEELKSYFENAGEKAFRAKQVFRHVYEGIPFSEMTDISKNLRIKLSEDFDTYLPQIAEKWVSKLDGTVKYLFKMCDGEVVEGVVMSYKHGLSMCVSTQVGCSMGCTFCASTLKGKKRNLSPGEISGQIMAAKKDLGQRISNIVLMGSGEPFDNYDNVIKFIKIANHEEALGIGARHITLSTCGLVPGILKLAEENIPINLSLSLHAPNDEIRKEIMPVAKKYDIHTLIGACREYFGKTKRRITYEYALIDAVNDSDSCAYELCALLRGGGEHVNLIPVNYVAERKTKKSHNVEAFRDILLKNGINATVRREMGADISAACGQLRNEYTSQNNN